jgi:DNA-binding helix-hairpin-helix protein with protein kinase domain
MGTIIQDSLSHRDLRPHTTCNLKVSSSGMAEIVNLRMARKRAARSKAEQHAAEQRMAHGVSKLEHDKAAADLNKARQTLDQHRIEPGDSR